MIVIIEGKIGSGLSQVLATLVKKENKKVYADAPFAFEYDHIDEEVDLERLFKVSDAVVAFDESYRFYDSRSSQTKANRLLSYLIAGSRKRGLSFFITTADFSFVDIRVRRSAEIKVVCGGLNNKGNIGIMIFDLRTGDKYRAQIDLVEANKLCLNPNPVFKHSEVLAFVDNLSADKLDDQYDEVVETSEIDNGVSKLLNRSEK